MTLSIILAAGALVALFVMLVLTMIIDSETVQNRIITAGLMVALLLYAIAGWMLLPYLDSL